MRPPTSPSGIRPSKRNSFEVQRFGVLIKRTFVFSKRRVRTERTVRFNTRANAASRCVPNIASSSRVQARRFSQHCGMPSECRLSCTAYRVRPNIRATTASGLWPKSSISRFDQRIRCGAKMRIPRDSRFPATAVMPRRSNFANSSSRIRPSSRSS